MTAAHPHFKPQQVTNKKTRKKVPFSSGVVWIGEVQPTQLSRKYQIKIEYRNEGNPKITVISPKLELLKGWTKPPQTYIGGYLCLYDPKSAEWHPGKSIADTIVPWISLWLFYYEAWLITGEWLGDGTEPRANETF